MALQSKIRGTSLYFIILFILTIFVYCRVLYVIIPSATSQSVEKEVSNQQRFAKLFLNETSDSIDIAEEERKATATILSRTAQLSKLLITLDASDVIEVYAVNRMAPLTSIASSVGDSDNYVRRMLDESRDKGSKTDTKAKVEGDTTSSTTSSSNIPSGPILVRKSALAFRYRSRVALASHGHHFSDEHLESLSPGDQLEQQKYFELTLEYGPQRTGAAKTSESMPIVHVDTEHQTTEDNNDNGKYVSWQNEGSIYYSTKISHDFTDAYYMASITGVVLEKIIQRAIQYTYKHPRYQPFEVISMPSQKQILKSSGSEDFVWHMFHELSDLFVDIDPLVLPPRARVQFYVSDIEDDNEQQKDDNQSTTSRRTNPYVQKVEGTSEASQAALFYEKFINCASAIRTGDYSMYMPPSDMVTNSTTIKGEDNLIQHRRRLRVVNNTSEEQAELINNTTAYGHLPVNSSVTIGESNATSAASNSTLITNMTTPEIIEDDPAEVAEKAAVEAVKAADIAVEAVKAAENTTAVTENSSSVVSIVQNATIEAAQKAQKAHDLSVAARSKASAEALISGDGDAVTSVISTCFSDAKYGILEQGQEGGEDMMDSTVVAYIYIDGHMFFKLNLASPYFGLLSSTISIPPPLMPKRGVTDISDWLIILFLLNFTLFGFVVMMHQIGVCFIHERLRFRHLFHPTNSLSSYHRRTGSFGVVEGELPLLIGRDDGVYLRGSLTCNNEKKRESND